MTDVFTRELEQAWGDAAVDNHEAFEPAQAWLDADRIVDFGDDDREPDR